MNATMLVETYMKLRRFFDDLISFRALSFDVDRWVSYPSVLESKPLRSDLMLPNEIHFIPILLVDRLSVTG